MAIPAAPSNLFAYFVAPSGFACTWIDNSSDETGFELERRNVAAGTEWLSTDPQPAANAESYDFGQGYTLGGLLQLRIRAVNGDGNSAWVESNFFSIQPAGGTGSARFNRLLKPR
jgi:hypothetical protein